MEKVYLFIPLVPMVMLVAFLNLLFSGLNGRPLLDIAEILNTVNRVAYAVQAMLVHTIL
jgi:hypothetical protein